MKLAQLKKHCARLLSLSALSLLHGMLMVCAAQTTNPTELQADVHGSDVHVNPVMGFNFSLDTTAQHNSTTGWSQIVTPDLSYRFNHHLSVSTSIPWYVSLNAFVPTKSGGTTVYPLTSGKNLLGDANVAGHIEASHNNFNYLFVGAVGFDTGNSAYGLSANTTTYNLTNHFDYQFGIFDPDIEIGQGDSTSLANQSVRRIYSAVGPVVNFQAGSWIDLPWNIGLDLEAYEELPIGNQKVYGTVTRKNKRGKTVSRQVLEGTGAAEDNGFNTELSIPIGNHFKLVGSYNRSFIQALDTASVGVTWTLRAPKLSHSH